VSDVPEVSEVLEVSEVFARANAPATENLTDPDRRPGREKTVGAWQRRRREPGRERLQWELKPLGRVIGAAPGESVGGGSESAGGGGGGRWDRQVQGARTEWHPG